MRNLECESCEVIDYTCLNYRGMERTMTSDSEFSAGSEDIPHSSFLIPH